MAKKSNFQPNWASPPWGTIADILRERQITLDSFQEQMGLDLNTLGMLVGGTLIINRRLAKKLSESLGASPRFWTRRDKQYRESLARIMATRELV